MYKVRVIPHSPNGIKWEGTFSTVGHTIEVAEKENGKAMDWKFREVNNSRKSVGTRATYFIEEI